MMSRIKSIIVWILTGAVSFVFIGSGLIKVSGSTMAIEMATGLGVAKLTLLVLGIVELLTAVLFLIPKTGIVGTLLMIAYMGGAMAAHLILDESMLFPTLIEVMVWLVACLRFPELTQRISWAN